MKDPGPNTCGDARTTATPPVWSISKISDAITLLAPGNVRYRIRLACIDAPSRSGVREPIQAEPLQPRLWETVNLDRGKKESYGWLVLVCKILLPDGEDQGRNDLALQAVREPADICRPAGLCPRRGCRQSIEGRPVERAILPRHPHGISATVLQQGCASIRRAIGLNVRQPVRGPSESIVAAASTSGRADPYYDSIGENNRVEFPNAAAAETAGVRSTRNCP